MRFLFVVALIGAFAMTLQTSRAGTLNVTNGQATWQSTKCTEPVEPASLMALSSNSRANDVNQTIAAYNQYVPAMQDYMNCLSNEAQTDASATNDAITHSAQEQIDKAQQKVSALNAALKSKH